MRSIKKKTTWWQLVLFTVNLPQFWHSNNVRRWITLLATTLVDRKFNRPMAGSFNTLSRSTLLHRFPCFMCMTTTYCPINFCRASCNYFSATLKDQEFPSMSHKLQRGINWKLLWRWTRHSKEPLPIGKKDRFKDYKTKGNPTYRKCAIEIL